MKYNNNKILLLVTCRLVSIQRIFSPLTNIYNTVQLSTWKNQHLWRSVLWNLKEGPLSNTVSAYSTEYPRLLDNFYRSSNYLWKLFLHHQKTNLKGNKKNKRIRKKSESYTKGSSYYSEPLDKVGVFKHMFNSLILHCTVYIKHVAQY